MPELGFAITQQQKSVTGSHVLIYGQLTQALATLAGFVIHPEKA